MSSIIDKFIFPIPQKKYGEKCIKNLQYNKKISNYFWIKIYEDKISIPCIEFKQKNATYSIIFSHGNATDIVQMHEYLQQISQHTGMNVFAYEYPGYGCVSGKPSGDIINRVILAVNKFIVNELHIPQDTIILFGNSLGSGPSCFLAQYLCKKNTPPASLILLSPYSSIKDMVYNYTNRFIRWLSTDHWNNTTVIKYVTCPTLIMHGIDDDIIPYSCSELLITRCPAYKKLILFENVNHNNIPFHNMIISINSFIESIVSK